MRFFTICPANGLPIGDDPCPKKREAFAGDVGVFAGIRWKNIEGRLSCWAVLVQSKMFFGKGAAGVGFEVGFEIHGLFLGAESNSAFDNPWTVFGGVGAPCRRCEP
jgi:hypothetical protein